MPKISAFPSHKLITNPHPQSSRGFAGLKLEGIMVSTTVNVVRYTALFSGVLYGWFHRRTLQVAHDQHKLEEVAHHRQKLVVEAKDAWKRRQESAKDTTVITDPDDPRFDLERLIFKLEKSS